MAYSLSDMEGRTGSPGEALGQSEAFLAFQEQISKVAPVDRPVLILGERGTGKELAASRVHFLSRRWQKPLVTLNCAVLTPTLIGAELFGYEKGAFTGAGSRRAGRFEQAADGTLFLDEIGNIPMEVQEKILRVVEYGSFERVGASNPVHVDVRIVAAANVDLSAMARAGRFKQDLLDRLSFEVIYVPPLRERQGDVLLLAEYFAGRMAYELGRQEVPDLSPQARKDLEAYDWPGNVRELKNVVERAVYKSTDAGIREISFNPFVSPWNDRLGAETEDGTEQPRQQALSGPEASCPDEGGTQSLVRELKHKPFKEAVLAFERYHLSSALAACRFNQKQAAGRLGLTYDQFRGLKKKHGL